MKLSRPLRTIALTAVLALALAAVSLAAVKLKSGTYTGSLAAPRTSYTLTMTLSGTKLSKITLSNIPLYCQGGGPAIPVQFAGTKVSKAGKFTTTGSHKATLGPYKGQVVEKLTLTGTFKANGTAGGTLKTVYVYGAGCGGRSAWSAKR